jgi:hypothetical protein
MEKLIVKLCFGDEQDDNNDVIRFVDQFKHWLCDFNHRTKTSTPSLHGQITMATLSGFSQHGCLFCHQNDCSSK